MLCCLESSFCIENGSENGHSNMENGDPREESDDNDSTDLDLDDDEIENLLDENLPENLKIPQKPKYEERFKTVLEGL